MDNMKYHGQLAYHIEMCCGCWPQFHDDRGLHGDKNQYWDWNWTINFPKRCFLDNITIFDLEGNEVYSGTWTWDRIKTGKSLTYFSCPSEIDYKEWMIWCSKGYRATIETDIIVSALKEKESK
jgi:hypothetical protein